jgi:hypothetical protein
VSEAAKTLNINLLPAQERMDRRLSHSELFRLPNRGHQRVVYVTIPESLRFMTGLWNDARFLASSHVSSCSAEISETSCPFSRMASAQFFFRADAILLKGH